jgi:5,10-methylenetetrahydrofolate reductase
MNQKRLKKLVAAGDKFIVVSEFVPLPGHRLKNFEDFLTGYAEKQSQLPDDIVVGGMTIPQSPSGIASLSPVDIYAILDKKNLWADLDVVPHVTTKDSNVDAIKSYLIGMRTLGIESVLALTGDKPAHSQGVFEVDAVGLIDLITEMNHQAYDTATPGAFDKVHQFYIAAAVSQYKYTEASQMLQYFKMAKKIKAGAHCLFTQLGWDWRKCDELFRYMKEENLDVPVFGNVYALTTLTPAPRLMHEGKLQGCVVTKELFDKLKSETTTEQLERAAQQMAMFRDLGAVGVDIGGIFDFGMLLEVVQRADEIGSNWREYQNNLDFGYPEGFYLYDGDGVRRPLSQPSPTFRKRSFDLFHNTFLEPDRGMHNTLQKVLSKSKSLREGKGGLYKAFFAGFEAPVKKMLFDCEECGDCYLVENFGICSHGKCEKGLDNPPCGDATPEGMCGNNPDERCLGELIYEAAASEGDKGLKKLADSVNPQRDPSLAGTASILNYLFKKDHTKMNPLIQIGETIHASIPKPGAAMKELLQKGAGALEQPSGALDYIISLIQSQVKFRANYLAVNVDAFGEDDPQVTVELMRDYVRLIRKYSNGVPVCVDSSNDDVLIAGLEQWYEGSPDNIAPPLINSVKTYSIDNILPLREKYPFKVLGMLVDDKIAGTDGSYSIDDLHGMARTIFDAATGKYGFVPDDLFFDSTVFPLAIDMPMTPDTPGYTYRTFQAIRKIMTDPAMKGVHTSLGISNCARDLPGRAIGVCRAYVAKAMEYGLDAGIVNVQNELGLKPADPDLLELVEAFAQQNGSAENSDKAMQLMSQFCQANKKKKR